MESTEEHRHVARLVVTALLTLTLVGVGLGYGVGTLLTRGFESLQIEQIGSRYSGPEEALPGDTG